MTVDVENLRAGGAGAGAGRELMGNRVDDLPVASTRAWPGAAVTSKLV
jgi:hypothetical protein